MSRRNNLLLALALSLSVAPACDEAIEGDFGAGDVAFRPGGFGSSGGVYLNTNAIGDHPLNEIDRMGNVHEDIELVAVYVKVPCNLKERGCKAQMIQLKEVWSEKGEIHGRDINGAEYKGAQFVDSRWDLNTYGGGIKSRSMFIQAYRFDWADGLHKYVLGYPNDPTYGVHFYTKKNQQIGETGLLASCATDAEGGIEAVVYEDTHVDMKSGDVKKQADLLNLACLSGGVGKAALWGYPAYAFSELEFQAAVRMIRADYLGNGDSYTKSGTAITAEDVWGVNTFIDPTLKTEALWTPWGAACIGLPRRPEFTQADVMAEGVAACEKEMLGSYGDDIMWTKVP